MQININLRKASMEDITHLCDQRQIQAANFGMNIWLQRSDGDMECYRIHSRQIFRQVVHAINHQRAFVPITTSINK